MTVLAWPFKPKMRAVESLEWKTDVIHPKKAETRSAIRIHPRVEYRYQYLFSAADYGAARELARTIGGDSFYVPDWPNGTQISAIGVGTVSLPVDASHSPAYGSGGHALIWDSNSVYEIVTVTSPGTGTMAISATTGAYSAPWVAPVRLAVFPQEFAGDRGPYDYVEAETVSVSTITEDLSGASGGLTYPTYLGDVVITDPAEMINGYKEGNIREVEPVDSKAGPLYNYPIFATPNLNAKLAWTVQSAADLWALRVFLHTRKGQQKRFWTLSWNQDVTVTKDIVPGDGFLQIAAIGFATKYPLNTDIGIVTSTGAFVGIRVTSVTTVGGNEKLNFAGSFSGGTVPISSIAASCKMTLTRFASDRIEIQHLPGRQATIAVATVEVPIYP